MQVFFFEFIYTAKLFNPHLGWFANPAPFQAQLWRQEKSSYQEALGPSCAAAGTLRAGHSHSSQSPGAGEAKAAVIPLSPQCQREGRSQGLGMNILGLFPCPQSCPPGLAFWEFCLLKVSSSTVLSVG